jgi:hypothetical protein
MICREPGFLAIVRFGSSLPLLPPLPSGTHRKTEERDNLLMGEGVGVEPNQDTARKLQYSLPMALYYLPCAALYIYNLFSPRRRIEERASLKHRNASRFLQEQAKRAKLTKDKDIQVPATYSSLT